MVWGMALPGSFGDFWPGGDYAGWDDELTEYFLSQRGAFESIEAFRVICRGFHG